MLQKLFTKEELHQCGKKIVEHLPYDAPSSQETMKQALDYYRKGSVFNIHRNGDSLEATVSGMERYHISIDLHTGIVGVDNGQEQLPLDEVEENLAPAISALLAVFASVDNIGSFLDMWKETKHIKGISGLKSARALIGGTAKASAKDTPTTSYDPTYLSQLETELSKKYINGPTDQLTARLNRFLAEESKKAPKDSITLAFFTLHIGLFVFERYMDWVRTEYPRTSGGIRSYHQAFGERILQYSRKNFITLETLTKEQVIAIPTEWIQETQARVRSTLSSFHFNSEVLPLYFSFWNLPLVKEDDRIHEIAQLVAVPNEPNTVIARAYLLMLSNQDPDTIELITANRGLWEEREAFTVLLPFFQKLKSMKEWSRLLRYLEVGTEILSSQSGAPRSEISTLLHYYSIVHEKTGNRDVYVRVLRQFLPYSLVEYEQFALEEEDYETWVEVQFMLGLEVGDHNRQILKYLGEELHPAMYPVYHALVEKSVEIRSKDGYEKAVYYMRRLKRLYEMHEREDEWYLYLNKLTDKYRRLRTFLNYIQSNFA